MMTQSEAIVTMCSSVVAVLAAIGGAVRYLVQILATIKRITDVAESVARQLQSHVEQSDTAHRATADKLADHDTQLAVVHTRIGTTGAGSTA